MAGCLCLCLCFCHMQDPSIASTGAWIREELQSDQVKDGGGTRTERETVAVDQSMHCSGSDEPMTGAASHDSASPNIPCVFHDVGLRRLQCKIDGVPMQRLAMKSAISSPRPHQRGVARWRELRTRNEKVVLWAADRNWREMMTRFAKMLEWVPSDTQTASSDNQRRLTASEKKTCKPLRTNCGGYFNEWWRDHNYYAYRFIFSPIATFPVARDALRRASRLSSVVG